MTEAQMLQEIAQLRSSVDNWKRMLRVADYELKRCRADLALANERLENLQERGDAAYWKREATAWHEAHGKLQNQCMELRRQLDALRGERDQDAKREAEARRSYFELEFKPKANITVMPDGSNILTIGRTSMVIPHFPFEVMG